MKKVNWGVIVAATVVFGVVAYIEVQLTNQLIGLGEMSENLMARTYNFPDEN